MKLNNHFALIPLALSFLVNSTMHAHSHHHSENSQTEFTADYVVVGVGTAGAVLANRLSADRKTEVIALHIGEYLTDDPLIKYSKFAIITVPAALLGTPLPINVAALDLPLPLKQELQTFLGPFSPTVAPLYDTGLTIPQSNAANRQLMWAMALPLGGASSINAGAWLRGTNQIYAQWEAVAGPEWSVEQITKLYTRLENYDGVTNDPEFRGHHGPINIRQVPASLVSTKFTTAIERGANVPFVLDCNDPLTPIGASSNVQLTQRGKNGKYRVSSVNAFLGKNVMSKNGHGKHGRKLRVLYNSAAQRIIWEGNKAVGVEFIQNGVAKTVRANKGVLLSAGINSSKLLLESGVGPQALLTSLNIPVIYNNPYVGQVLADQPSVNLIYSTNPADKPSENSLFSSIAMLPAPGGDPQSRQFRFAPVDAIPGLAYVFFDLVQPKSRGAITINSANPDNPFVMDLGELTNPDDLALYMSGLSTYIPAINAQLQLIDPLYEMIYPDPAVLEDPILLSIFIQNSIISNQCFQCHCRMAAEADGGVVDSAGRVYGVQNLIVADDSVIPVLMDGTPMATAYLIAANIARIMGY